MAQSLSKIHIRMNAFALPGRTTQHIHTIPRVSLCLPWAMRSLGFQPARFAPLTVSSACPLRLPWAMRSLGFAMHYWLHLSNSSMLDCIRFERSFSPFETKSETLGRTRQTLWSAVQMLTQKLCCQTIHDCPKVVPLHYESE